MKRGWFGALRGAHRVPEPGSLLAEADEARARAAEPAAVIETVKVVPLADTQAFDAAEMWDETGRAADAEPPPPVVTEPVFHRAISVSLRRDHAQLPVFRQTVKAHGGFAGLHMRAPSITRRVRTRPAASSGGTRSPGTGPGHAPTARPQLTRGDRPRGSLTTPLLRRYR